LSIYVACNWGKINKIEPPIIEYSQIIPINNTCLPISRQEGSGRIKKAMNM